MSLVLVTGGAGYIGSHTVLQLLESGYETVVVDNLSNSSPESLNRVKELTGKEIIFYKADLLDVEALKVVFRKHKFHCVMHLAGMKAVGESCEKPLQYYSNNLMGTINLLQVMREFEVADLIFSSSTTVYGKPQHLPLDENHVTGQCTNPYGQTKFFIEEMLKEMCALYKGWNVVMLRYFNPVGSHESGLIGEDPNGVPNNLMPYIAQVAVGKRPKIIVFGNDYNTHDGTGVRDYIHVVDLAKAHVIAVKKLEENCGCKVYNLGTGKGDSVLDVIKAFEKACGKTLPYEIVGRRPGDVDSCYSDPSLAVKELDWKAEKNLEQMCEDVWRWQSLNPDGYQSSH